MLTPEVPQQIARSCERDLAMPTLINFGIFIFDTVFFAFFASGHSMIALTEAVYRIHCKASFSILIKISAYEKVVVQFSKVTFSEINQKDHRKKSFFWFFNWTTTFWTALTFFRKR